LAVLLSEFEFELCDPDAADAAMPQLREVAFGIMQPQEILTVRIRKRKAGGKI